MTSVILARRLAAAWIAAVALAGCTPRAAALVVYEHERAGVRLKHPAGWKALASPDGNWVLIVPDAGAAGAPNPSRYAEFVSVRVVPGKPPSSDDALRREAFTLLPFHGVAKFQRAPSDGVRYRFEGTGAASGAQWAGVGVLDVEAERIVHIVCAKPVEKWREGQKQCDETITSVTLRAR
jgi:hypothetical protein